VDPHFRVGFVQSWHWLIQRDLPGALVMVAAYTGSKGSHGTQQFLPNTYPAGATHPCTYCPAGFAWLASGGSSSREAGQIQLRRRLRSGFAANLQYTYSKSIDDAAYQTAGLDNLQLKTKLGEITALSTKVYERITALNRVYQKVGDLDGKQARSLRKLGTDYDKKLLAAYKISQDELTKLDWYQTPIFAHEDPQNNLILLDQIIATLKEGNGTKALDDLLWKVQDEWYDYAFDRKVIDHLIYEGLLQPKSRLFWGAGRIVSNVDLYDIVQSVKQKSAAEKADYSEEIVQLQKIKNDQIQILKKVTAEEIGILNKVENVLKSINLEKPF
jgi:hypothetical protein